MRPEARDLVDHLADEAQAFLPCDAEPVRLDDPVDDPLDDLRADVRRTESSRIASKAPTTSPRRRSRTSRSSTSRPGAAAGRPGTEARVPHAGVGTAAGIRARRAPVRGTSIRRLAVAPVLPVGVAT